MISINKVACVKFSTDKFLKELMGLKATEKAVYTTLVLLMNDKKAPLMNNASYLSSWCGCSVRTFQKTLETLISTGHITRLENGGLWHKSLAFDFERVNKASENASRAALARWGKKREEAMHVN
ncbi:MULTISPECIES: DUF1376 domain-containing protein [unclassified Bartonella]|uniref:DUF1376 domain-containing protein n=1 Tax=unclassified Bartonella TaxID=2645622 RepID=UPI0020C1E744|nr:MULTISPECIES: DUF1376 domain-containing protein [unclassified Bartonella]